MRHCNIAPLHQLGTCRNKGTVDNTFPTWGGGGYRLGYKINEI